MLLESTPSRDWSLVAYEGKLSPSRPPYISGVGTLFSGWRFTLYGVLDHRAQSLSSFIESRLGRVDFSESGAVLTLSYNEPDSRTEWALDRQRGYALAGHKEFQGPTLVYEMVVESFEEALPGIYFPARATKTLYSRDDGAAFERQSFIATHVVVNDPDFGEEVFTLEWPPGTSVWDEATNQSFVVAAESFDAAVAGVTNEVDNATESVVPERKPDLARDLEVTRTDGDRPGLHVGPSGSTLGWSWLGTVVLVVLAVVCALSLKRKLTSAPVGPR
ncbi:MAG: hypothetical protein AB7I09_02990 [Planctomycetota bacterium]